MCNAACCRNLLEDWTSQLARLKSDAAALLALQQALSDGTPRPANFFFQL